MLIFGSATTSPPTITDAARVKAAFILRGTTLRAWCRSEGISTAYASRALAGKQLGPKAAALRERLLTASGVRVG